MTKEQQLMETAARFNFNVQQVDGKTSRKQYRLIANWAYEDGYKPATVAMSAKEAYIYLCGFAAAKYQP